MRAWTGDNQAHCCQRRARIKYGGERERYFRKRVTARCCLGALASRPAIWGWAGPWAIQSQTLFMKIAAAKQYASHCNNEMNDIQLQ